MEGSEYSTSAAVRTAQFLKQMEQDRLAGKTVDPKMAAQELAEKIQRGQARAADFSSLSDEELEKLDLIYANLAATDKEGPVIEDAKFLMQIVERLKVEEHTLRAKIDSLAITIMNMGRDRMNFRYHY